MVAMATRLVVNRSWLMVFNIGSLALCRWDRCAVNGACKQLNAAECDDQCDRRGVCKLTRPSEKLTDIGLESRARLTRVLTAARQMCRPDKIATPTTTLQRESDCACHILKRLATCA